MLIVLNNMKEISLVLKDNDILNIDGNNKIYNIKTLPNSNITINEYNNDGCIINLDINNDSSIKYISVYLNNGNINRNIILNKGSNLEFDNISISNLIDNTIVNLNNEYSNVVINNLCLNNDGNDDIKTIINHNYKKSKSKIFNIGVAFNNANIMFDTTGFVKKGQSGCDCRQLSKGVVVGDKSKITSKPILLIDEFDVKAYHGATIGKMSDDELFYLMSRGLNKTEAFMLMLNGLINPIVNKVIDETLKTNILKNIYELLGD